VPLISVPYVGDDVSQEAVLVLGDQKGLGVRLGQKTKVTQGVGVGKSRFLDPEYLRQVPFPYLPDVDSGSLLKANLTLGRSCLLYPSAF
jgi:hypothetical protein